MAIRRNDPFSDNTVQPTGRLLDSKRGVIGQEKQIAAGENAVLVDVTSPSGSQSEVVTVTLSMRYAEDNPAQPAVAAIGRARVEWSAGNARHEAMVDYKQGSKFTLSCSQLKVTAYCDVLAAGTNPYFCASVGYGPTTTRASRTTSTNLNRASNVVHNVRVSIPRFAKRYMITRFPLNGLTVNQLDIANNILQQYTLPAAQPDGSVLDWRPVHPLAVALNIINNTDTDIANSALAATFELDL